MKFSIVSLLVSAAFFSQIVATPATGSAPAAPASTCVLHCGGPHGLACPAGYRCCGPIVLGVGGHCVPGAKGICPL